MAFFNRGINTPSWVNGLTIYEVNLRQYTNGGTLQEFEQHLPRLKELGVGILWFMPVNPIGTKNRKGNLGSYYSICDYLAINPEFGTISEFKILVEKIHKLGMFVIIDWVANHTAWDHIWTEEHPGFYLHNEQGGFSPPFPEWEDVIKLDYDNPCLWEKMINAMEFWIKEINIDGFRCDMAHLVPTHFWNMARFRLDKIKPVYMLAESENYDLLAHAFDTIYNWKLLHLMNNFSSGKLNLHEWIEQTRDIFSFLPPGASLLNFTSNHDENSWNGTSGERMHTYKDIFTVISFLLPGIPLIYSGQETGEEKRLAFFDKDEIIWKDNPFNEMYSKLGFLKRAYPAFNFQDTSAATTISADQQGILTLRITNTSSYVIALFNMSANPVTYSFENDRTYLDLFSGENYNPATRNLEIEPFGFRIIKICDPGSNTE